MVSFDATVETELSVTPVRQNVWVPCVTSMPSILTLGIGATSAVITALTGVGLQVLVASSVHSTVIALAYFGTVHVRRPDAARPVDVWLQPVCTSRTLSDTVAVDGQACQANSIDPPGSTRTRVALPFAVKP